ncbi:XRE family transcriptional regulator, thiamine biosynthesis regulator [Halorhabdus sp. SVX81]|uniref:thiamine-phosphate synthase family protein n=1 Tax=Halorhabdus sp. SVX81 TaxID=2978283 RepID=UPI0023DBEFEA|nr:thiamine-phosphate synthase family protein [Halorhabdus sp. SVX81]WEL18023.1 XRE family transcriptional regulator, thiamine biosynthesis regulator [Halorhabdus sp. SVX81]
MKFVEEVVVEEFLPTFRSMLAERLRDRGLTQLEVADQLGISQSAVSKYAHGEVERNESLLEDDRLQELTDSLADGLAAGEVSPVQALAEAEVFIRQLEQGDLLAQLHKEAFPSLAEHGGTLAIHDPESRVRQSEQVRSSVRRGLGMLENASGFARLIPAVGSNLVECLPDAGGIDDVVAVPGRILDVKGRAAVPGDPEFGVSEYVASVLLAARRHGSDARATLNVAYEPGVVTALEARGYTAVEFDAEAELDAAFDAVDVAGADVLYQTGGFGIEPIVYVLGADAPTVVSSVREIVDEV